MKRLILLVGPTCSGKSTLEKELNRRGIPSVVSYTTRTPRTGEIHTKDYYFITEDEVNLLESKNQIVQKVQFSGAYYGSTYESLGVAFENSDTAVIVVEPTGVMQFMDYARSTGMFTTYSVYVSGRLVTLVMRLLSRYNEDANADAAKYWQRLEQQVKAFHEWPRYIDNWNLVFDEIEDSIPGKSVQDAATKLLDSLDSQ